MKATGQHAEQWAKAQAVATLISAGYGPAEVQAMAGLPPVTDGNLADLQRRWRQGYAAGATAHRITFLSPGISPSRTPVTCSYCRADPGTGQRCRTCGAPSMG